MSIVSCSACGAKNRVKEQIHARVPVCGRCGATLQAAPPSRPDVTGSPLVITDATFARDVLNAGGRPVLLDCWAEWCGPCRMVAPVLDQLASESAGRYQIAKLNVDENPNTAARLGIQSIPTMFVFKNGKVVDRIIGAQPRQVIAAKLAAHQA